MYKTCIVTRKTELYKVIYSGVVEQLIPPIALTARSITPTAHQRVINAPKQQAYLMPQGAVGE